MKTLFLAFSISFFSLAASATSLPEQLTGYWQGQGTYLLSGVMSHCRGFQMSYTGTPNSFTFEEGHRDCDNHSETFLKVTMDFHDGKLWMGEQEVGGVVDNVLFAGFSMPEGNGHVRHWRMTMRLQGNALVYEESRRMDDEQTPLITFAGILVRQKN